MYASARSAMSAPLPMKQEEVRPAEEVPVQAEPKKEEVKTVEDVVKIETGEKTFPVLPSVHFKRNFAVIDTVRYAGELARIVEVLKSMPEVKVDIRGYTDHTGSDRINRPLSLKRAEALKTYLVSKGIAADRMNVFGEGKDLSVDKKDIYSEKARKVEVRKRK